jgi:hypothetical protein
MENVATPVFIRLGTRARPYKPGQYVSHIDDVKDIFLNNITVLNAKLPSSIIGINSKKIRNIVVSNYSVRNAVAQIPTGINKVPFEEFSYPAASVFRNLPAYGFYCRNVDELHMQDLYMYPADNEVRPALVFDRINNLELFSVKAEIKTGTTPIYLRNSKGVYADFCRSTGVGGALFVTENNSVENIHLSNSILQKGQKEVETTAPLQDEGVYEDFSTDLKYSVVRGEKFKGLDAWDLRANPLRFKMEINKRGSLQLCLLILNNSSHPEKVLVKFEGITQEFRIDWNEWGWAPVTLLKEYPADRKVDFEIVAGDQESDLKISKAYIRYQDVRKTD